MENFSSAVNGVNSQDVMNLVMMTQYFDTIKELGMSGKNSIILIPHGPGGMTDMSDQIRNAMITAEQVNKASTKSA